MIFDILKWYLVLTGIGLIGFPIAFSFLKKITGTGLCFCPLAGFDPGFFCLLALRVSRFPSQHSRKLAACGLRPGLFRCFFLEKAAE